jgi:hypothetical protein
MDVANECNNTPVGGSDFWQYVPNIVSDEERFGHPVPPPPSLNTPCDDPNMLSDEEIVWMYDQTINQIRLQGLQIEEVHRPIIPNHTLVMQNCLPTHPFVITPTLSEAVPTFAEADKPHLDEEMVSDP